MYVLMSQTLREQIITKLLLKWLKSPSKCLTVNKIGGGGIIKIILGLQWQRRCLITFRFASPWTFEPWLSLVSNTVLQKMETNPRSLHPIPWVSSLPRYLSMSNPTCNYSSPQSLSSIPGINLTSFSPYQLTPVHIHNTSTEMLTNRNTQTHTHSCQLLVKQMNNIFLNCQLHFCVEDHNSLSIIDRVAYWLAVRWIGKWLGKLVSNGTRWNGRNW